jgi:mono/diheme cytochrome c family protein
MKGFLKIISLAVVGSIVAVTSLVVGYQLGRTTQALDIRPWRSIESDRSQGFGDRTTLAVPEDAPALYAANCASCHNTAGQGSRIAPALNNPELRTRLSDNEIKATIENGRPGTAMPAWKGRLTESEINTLTSLIRNLGELDPEQLSDLEAQIPFRRGAEDCQGGHTMMMGGCGSGMGGHMWGSP